VIKFIERRPRFGCVSRGTGIREYIPIYMVIDGKKEYFVTNRIAGEDRPEIEEYKKMLIANNGQYFRLFGHCENPFDLIAQMKERKHHLTHPTKVFYSAMRTCCWRLSTGVSNRLDRMINKY